MKSEQDIQAQIDDLLYDIEDCRENDEHVLANALFTASEYLRWVIR